MEVPILSALYYDKLQYSIIHQQLIVFYDMNKTTKEILAGKQVQNSLFLPGVLQINMTCYN